MSEQTIREHAESVAAELQHLAGGNATCFDVSQWTSDALGKRGLPAYVAGTKGHSFVIVEDYIVDLWEPSGAIKAKVWERGHVPTDQDPSAYEVEAGQ
jgi:hypothetical protein